jgi:hypothetical protein
MTHEIDRNWKFDQGREVTAITTEQVLEQGLPILEVIHFGDDCSWAFLCGTTEDESDARLVNMETIVAIDPSLSEIASLEPGQIAYRDFIGDAWEIVEEEDDEDF